MVSQDDPKRPSKKVCTAALQHCSTAASRIKVHKCIKKVESDPNIRVPGGNTLRQLVPLQRRTSMPIMPKRSLVHCAENVPPFGARPICMPNPPQDCSGFYMSIGWCTIFSVSILPPEKFLLSLWASSRG